MAGRRIAAAACALVLALLAGGGGAMAAGLDDLRWKNRVLVVFADERGDLDRQAALLARDEAALAEREMVVLAVEGGRVRALHGAAPGGTTASSLRAALDAPESGFEAVLIGKDGGVKHRAREPIGLERLNAIIDAMPMRRAGR